MAKRQDDENGDGTERPAAAHGESGDEPGAGYTIDELSALTNVPSRTIRYYQSKGTLPPPERRGRVAVYDDEHVSRLRLIAELQDRGLRLDAIRDVLGQLEAGGDSLQDWLGVGEHLQAPWTDERAVVLTQADILKRFGGGRPGLISELESSTLIRREGNSLPAVYLVPSLGLLEISVRLERAGIDLQTMLGASDLMRRRLGQLSDDMVGYFADRAGQGFGRDFDPKELVKAYDALRPIGMDALRIIFAQEIERSLREFVESGQVVRPVRQRARDRERSRSSSDSPSSASPSSSKSSSSSSSGSGKRKPSSRGGRHGSRRPR